MRSIAHIAMIHLCTKVDEMRFALYNWRVLRQIEKIEEPVNVTRITELMDAHNQAAHLAQMNRLDPRAADFIAGRLHDNGDMDSCPDFP